MIYRVVNEDSLKKRRFILGVLTIFTIINTGVNFGIDLLINGSLTWSFYPVYSVIFTWLLCTPLLFRHERLAIWLGVFSTVLLPYLFLMDLVFPPSSWFVPIALPIAVGVIVFLWVCYVAYVIHSIKNKERDCHVN